MRRLNAGVIVVGIMGQGKPSKSASVLGTNQGRRFGRGARLAIRIWVESCSLQKTVELLTQTEHDLALRTVQDDLNSWSCNRRREENVKS